MSGKALSSSGASRPPPRPIGDVGDLDLESSQGRSFGGSNGSEPLHMDRRRSHLAVPTDDLLKPSITVKPHPSNLQSQPRVLSPLMLLPRENLPLSSLDLSNPNGHLPASRLYESNIKILELEGRLGSNILLARSETSQIVYAIEREKKGLYIACKLGAWVDVTQLAQQATVVCGQKVRSLRRPLPIVDGTFAITTLQSHHENKKRRLAIEELQSAVRKRPRSQSAATAPSQQSHSPVAVVSEQSTNSKHDSPSDELNNHTDAITPPLQAADPVSAPAGQPVSDEVVLQQPTARDIFKSIQAQYLDILYHSVGSLAYFAKGPLSRARATFHLDCDANLEMDQLIEFLRGLVLTTVLIDKKYRETVPDIVSKTKTHIEDSDIDTRGTRRKNKKAKLGKDGLYPAEDGHIRSWWAAHRPADSTDDDRMMTQQEISYHISCLRRRETQLQMIIILEILALEPLKRMTGNAEESQLPGMDAPGEPHKPGAAHGVSELVPRKRKKHNLPVLLDIHADRLCIWQTTTLEEVKALAESQLAIQGQGGQNLGRASSDPLKDFCVDIIVPFFSARLPEFCDSINRKLGGPIIKSPPKPKQFSKPTSTKPKPGSQIKKAGSSSKRARDKTLEEVLSKERMRRSVSRGPDAVALLRSASVPFVPTLKREVSEPALSMIPKVEVGSLKERPVNVFWKPYSTNTDERARKKADIEAELQNAILALKKPNRALAGREITDAAERRASTGSLKKLKKPIRHSASSAVQVKATPANNRFKDAVGAIGQANWHDSQANFDADNVPSSASVVPSTVIRKNSSNLFGLAVAVTPTVGDVQATPARVWSNLAPFPSANQNDDIAILPSSPIMARKVPPTAKQQLLPVPNRPGLVLPSSPGLGALFETPLKLRSVASEMDRLDETPIRSRLPVSEKVVQSEQDIARDMAVPNNTKQQTIYQQLGWDDDDLV